MTSPRRLTTYLSAGLIGLGLSSVAGCGGPEKEGPIEQVEGTAARLVLPVEEENQLGQRREEEIEQQLTLVDDSEITGYVQELGRQVVQAAGDEVPEGIDIDFKVVREDETVNAFAIPGGSIYVYTGLLRAVDSEAELMAVLSHEVAHVTERHIAEQLAAQYGLQTLSALALGQEAGVLGQLVGTVAQQGSLITYTRAHEREADSTGIRYETQAGWDPHGYVSFFEHLSQMEGRGDWVPSWLQTHPAPEDRVENAREAIAQMDRVPRKTGRESYQTFKQLKLGGSGTK